jgi:hypothetical protein
VQLKGLGKPRNSTEFVTYQLVAQCLNQLCYCKHKTELILDSEIEVTETWQMT